MSRKPRSAEGDVGIFHIYNRGNNKKQVFHDDEDYSKLCRLLLQAKEKTGIQIYYYALMPNHFHLLIRAIRTGAMSAAMKLINQKYSIWHKNKYGGIGHLWQDRFKSKLIESEEYFAACSAYIELNPVKDGLCSHPKKYRWTSYHSHAFASPNVIVDFDHQYLAGGSDLNSRRETYRQRIQRKMEMGCLTGFAEAEALMSFR